MRRELIRCLSIVTAVGAKTYCVGTPVGDKVIHKIVVGSLYFTGDPYDHYIGYTEGGEMLFSVNCLCPCDVEYLQKV